MTCFGRYIGHHQVVHSLIFTANYTIYNVFVNELLCTSIKSAFKIMTVAVELKSYSEIKNINRRGGLWCQTGYIPVWQHWFSVVSQWIGCLLVLWWLVLGRCYVEVHLQPLWWSLLAAGGWNTYTFLCSWKVQVWMLLLHIGISIMAMW